MTRLFGTDGVRGKANDVLTPELAYALGRYGASVLLKDSCVFRPRVLIGRDTRISGEMLESALIAGITSVGADVLRLGVIPTPGVAHLTRTWQADAGIMISASHNPAQDNGIKFFSGDGYKLADEVEDKIEKLIHGATGNGVILFKERPLRKPGIDGARRAVGKDVGRLLSFEDPLAAYGKFLMGTVDCSLKDLKVVVDCGNGAAYRTTPVVLEKLGADVISLHDKPDGLNINVDCGSTHPESLIKAVLHHKADMGIAHDGDADRLIAVDEKGNLLDGDHILTICGMNLLRQGRLANNTLAATVYSNMGVQAAFKKAGADVIITPNGDRYVLEAMRERDLNFGGEQSGHIIFLDYNTTGDGVLTALQLLAVVQKESKPLSELAKQLEKYPQVLINVPVKDRQGWQTCKSVQDAIDWAKTSFGDAGRIYVRASGTEPLVRVMAEGQDRQKVYEAAQEVAERIQRGFGKQEMEAKP
ncbi:MAG: phosphoglucosamine mutase [Firmicutes bacterium]|nr:phosphoglucosamine mutase [Bacillota bacterium]